MTLCLALLTLASMCGVAQQEQPLERLIAALGDEDASVRNSALEAILAVGPQALPMLRRTLECDDVEVAERAAFAIAQLERVVKLSAVMTTRPSLTMVLEDLPFSRALAQVAQVTGMRFRGSICSPEVLVSGSFDHAPLMEVLDALGTAADLQWSFEDEKTVTWKKSAPPPRPTCYVGGFKVMLSRIDVYQSWDYQEGRGILWIYFDACTEPGMLPVGPPMFEVTELRDEECRELSRDVPVEESTAQGMAPAGAEARTGLRFRSNPFMVSPLDRSVRRLSKVSGSVKFLFPLDRESIELADLCEASTAVRGDLTVEANDILMNSIKLTFRSRNQDPQLSRRLASDGLILVDANGNRRVRGKDFDVHIDQMTADTVRFSVEFNDGVTFLPISARFTLVKSFFEKVVPFEFKDVTLP